MLLVHEFANSMQKELYTKFNNFSVEHKNLGRCLSLPVALLDVTVNFARMPLAAIENAAKAAIHLVGACFTNKSTMLQSINYTESTLGCIFHIPITIVLAPIKFVYQSCINFSDPTQAHSIDIRMIRIEEFNHAYQQKQNAAVR